MIWAMSSNSNTLEDLVVYVRSYTRQFMDDHQLPVQFVIPENIPPAEVSGPVKRNLFLVIKEALHNIVKHADARSVKLEMEINDREFRVRISDNGKGIQEGTGNRFGNGLKNMERRMREIQGQILFENDGGTIVTIVLPL